jgi:hypothetical protein
VVDQRPYAPRLRPGQEVADDAARRQHERVLGIDVFHRRRVLRGKEAGLAVGKVERPRALGDGVPGARLEQARGSGMGFVRARPEDAVRGLDLLVRDPRIVRDAAFRGHTQLVEDLARAREREPALPSERARDVLDDLPIRARVAGGLDRLPDADDAPFGGRDRPFVLLVERARQHDVGVPRGLRQEEVMVTKIRASRACADRTLVRNDRAVEGTDSTL